MGSGTILPGKTKGHSRPIADQGEEAEAPLPGGCSVCQGSEIHNA